MVTKQITHFKAGYQMEVSKAKPVLRHPLISHETGSNGRRQCVVVHQWRCEPHNGCHWLATQWPALADHTGRRWLGWPHNGQLASANKTTDIWKNIRCLRTDGRRLCKGKAHLQDASGSREPQASENAASSTLLFQMEAV